jgi:hypothetical protein
MMGVMGEYGGVSGEADLRSSERGSVAKMLPPRADSFVAIVKSGKGGMMMLYSYWNRYQVFSRFEVEIDAWRLSFIGRASSVCGLESAGGT